VLGKQRASQAVCVVAAATLDAEEKRFDGFYETELQTKEYTF